MIPVPDGQIVSSTGGRTNHEIVAWYGHWEFHSLSCSRRRVLPRGTTIGNDPRANGPDCRWQGGKDADPGHELLPFVQWFDAHGAGWPGNDRWGSPVEQQDRCSLQVRPERQNRVRGPSLLACS